MGAGVNAWGKSWGLAWGASWGALVVFPQYVDPTWPAFEITEQIARATGGGMPLTLLERQRRRRGW